MDVAVLSNARGFALAVECEAAVIHEAFAGDESHRAAGSVHLTYLKKADPSWPRTTMPAANLPGRFLECSPAQEETRRKCEIEANAEKDEYQEGRLKENW